MSSAMIVGLWLTQKFDNVQCLVNYVAFCNQAFMIIYLQHFDNFNNIL